MIDRCWNCKRGSPRTFNGRHEDEAGVSEHGEVREVFVILYYPVTDLCCEVILQVLMIIGWHEALALFNHSQCNLDYYLVLQSSSTRIIVMVAAKEINRLHYKNK